MKLVQLLLEKMLKTVLREGVEPLKELILKNLNDVKELIEWNETHGIRVYRLSSSMFPHKTNPQVEDFGYEFAIPLMQEIGELARKYGHRLTFHPGQYNVLASPSQKALDNTMRDLAISRSSSRLYWMRSRLGYGYSWWRTLQ